MNEPGETVYWLQCPEGQENRRVRLIRYHEQLLGLCWVRDVDNGETLCVTKNRLQAPLPGVAA